MFACLLAKCLNAFAEKNNLFTSLQFDFCKGLGACDALLIITSVIQKALDSGYEVRMVGLDFSVAFDCINYEALILKLRQLGLGYLLMVTIVQGETLYPEFPEGECLALYFSFCIPMICGLGLKI